MLGKEKGHREIILFSWVVGMVQNSAIDYRYVRQAQHLCEFTFTPQLQYPVVDSVDDVSFVPRFSRWSSVDNYE